MIKDRIATPPRTPTGNPALRSVELSSPAPQACRLARKYGVSNSTMHAILRGKIWKHLL